MAGYIFLAIVIAIASVILIYISSSGSIGAVVFAFIFCTPIIGGICLILRNHYYMNLKLNKLLNEDGNKFNIFAEEGKDSEIIQEDESDEEQENEEK